MRERRRFMDWRDTKALMEKYGLLVDTRIRKFTYICIVGSKDHPLFECSMNEFTLIHFIQDTIGKRQFIEEMADDGNYLMNVFKGICVRKWITKYEKQKPPYKPHPTYKDMEKDIKNRIIDITLWLIVPFITGAAIVYLLSLLL